MFREKRAKSMKKVKQEMRSDPNLSKMPDPPVTGPGLQCVLFINLKLKRDKISHKFFGICSEERHMITVQRNINCYLIIIEELLCI